MGPKGSLGVFLKSFGGALGDFLGPLDVLLGALGCLWGPLGGPLGVQGRPWVATGRFGADFRDFPGNSGSPFGMNLVTFCMFFWLFFGVCFLIDF